MFERLFCRRIDIVKRDTVILRAISK